MLLSLQKQAIHWPSTPSRWLPVLTLSMRTRKQDEGKFLALKQLDAKAEASIFYLT